MNPVMAWGMVWVKNRISGPKKLFHTAVHAVLAASGMVLVKNGTNELVNHFATATAASLIAVHAAMTIFRNVALLVHARYSPAARAAIAAMTSPIGLAVSAMFSRI